MKKLSALFVRVGVYATRLGAVCAARTSRISRIGRRNAVCATFAMVWLAFASPAAAQVEINETNFPDAAFRTYLTNITYNTDRNNILSQEELDKVTQIGSPNKNSTHKLPAEVKDLTGIKLFPKLKSLYATKDNNNGVTSLDVSGLTTLTTIQWTGNGLTSLNVSGCTNLATLHCYQNQLTSLNVSGCTALLTLQCHNNKLTSLDVSSCTKINEFVCAGNQLTSVDVSKNTAMTQLYCYSNKLTSLEVSKNTNLQLLSCFDNQLTSLDLRTNTVLTQLYCGKNNFTSIDYNSVQLNSPLKHFWCDECPLLESLDLSGNKTLEVIVCWDCPLLESVNMSNCPNLTDLHCKGNPVLKNLNVSGCTALKTETFAFFDDPLLSNVDISGCTSLTAFDPGGKLTVLNARGCTSLTRISYTSGSLTALDVSGCTALETLQVSRNQLTSLDLSSIKTLTALSCEGNRLKRLVQPDINWDNAKWLSASGNHIPLSLLYEFRLNETYKTWVEKGSSKVGQSFGDWPQSDTAYLNINDVLDLSSEKALGPDGDKKATKYKFKYYNGETPVTVEGSMDADKTVAGVFEYTAATGIFKFLKAGVDTIELKNELVNGAGSSAGRPFTWVVNVGGEYCDVELTPANTAMGSVAGAGRYAKNASVRITASAKPGYRFVNWTHTNGGAVFGTKWDTTFAVTEALNLTANFVQVYTITLQANDATMGRVSGRGEYDANASVTIEATPDRGFRFVKWKNGTADFTATPTANPLTFTATENLNLTAEFEWITYKITVQPDRTDWGEGAVWGTVATDKADGIYKQDSLVTVTAMPTACHRFVKWMNGTEMVSTDRSYKFNATQDLNLTAVFEIITYTVTVNVVPEGAGEIGGLKNEYLCNEGFVLSANVKQDGYRFKCWREGDRVLTTHQNYYEEAYANLVLTAEFEPIPTYTITLNPNDAIKGSVSGSGEYREDAEVTITAKAKENYYFVRWVHVSTLATFSKMKDTTFQARENLDLKAEFMAVPVNAVRIRVKTNGIMVGRASITGDGTYEPGTDVTISAEAGSGYEFVNWKKVDGKNKVEFATTATHTFKAGNENMELWAYFVNKPPYNILAQSNDTRKGTVDFDGCGKQVPVNTVVSIWANPKPGCHLREWQYVEYDGVTIETFTKKEDTSFKAYRNFTLTAVFDSNTHLVTALSENADKGSVEGSGTYTLNSYATVKAAPNEGYSFKEWKNGEDVIENAPAEYTFQVKRDVTLTAYFDDLFYEIKVSPNDYNRGWVSVNENGRLREGATVTILSEPNPGFRFVHWIHTQTGEVFATKMDTTFKVIENLDLTAVFEPITYKITVISSNQEWGTVSPAGTNNYPQGAEIELVAARTSQTYRFKEWQDITTGTPQTLNWTSSHKLTVTEDRTLMAVFEETYWNITVKSGQSAWGSVAISAGPYKHRSTVKITATPKGGFRFVKWMNGNVEFSKQAEFEFPATADMELTAIFEEIPIYTIALQANDANMGDVSGAGTYKEDSVAVIDAEKKTGYHFVKWVHTASNETFTKTKRYTFKAKENLALTAMFEAVPENAITVEVLSAKVMSGSAFITGDGVYAPGTEVTISAVPKVGNKFVEWKIENGSGTTTLFTKKSDTTFVVRENMKLWADFVNEPPHTIMVEANNAEWGAVKVKAKWEEGTGLHEQDHGNRVPEGADVSISATPKEGYRFVNWMYVDRASILEVFGTKEDTTFKADQHLNLTAYFAPNRYTITVQSDDEEKGMVFGGGTYESGSMVTVTAMAKEGYRFSAWKNGEEPVSTQASYTFEATEDITLTATFTEAPYHQVTLSVNNANAGSVRGADWYKENARVSIYAIEKEGYRFKVWKIGNSDTVFCHQKDTTFVITKEMNLKAYFDSVTYTVTTQTDNADMGSVSGSGIYKEGSIVRINATAKEGYRFVEWKKGDTVFTRRADTSFKVMRNLTLTAYFEPIPVPSTYTIKVYANNTDWGYVMLGTGGDSGAYEKDAEVTVVATPKENYRFVEWRNTATGEVMAKTAVYTFNATQDLELTAYFAEKIDKGFAYVKDRVIYLSTPMGKVQIFGLMGQFIYEGEGTAFRVQNKGIYILRAQGRNIKVIVP